MIQKLAKPKINTIHKIFNSGDFWHREKNLKNHLTRGRHRWKFGRQPVPTTFYLAGTRYSSVPTFFFSLVPGTQRYPISEIFSVQGNQRYPRFLNFDEYRPLMPTPTFNTKKHENSNLKKFLKKISVSQLLTRFLTQEKTQNYYTKKILTLKKFPAN